MIGFGKRGKLNPKYLGPSQILAKIGNVAYKLALPLQLANIHNVFHISVFKRHISELTQLLIEPQLHIEENLSYDETPIKMDKIKEN